MKCRRFIPWIGGQITALPWRRLCLGVALMIAVFVGGGWATAHLVSLPDRLDYGDSVVATYEDGRPAHALLSEDDRWRFPTQLEDVDPAYLEALVALEDRRFHRHFGVDPMAIVRAFFDNLRAGSTVSGASTITMQLVRLLEPRPRTLRSKAVEALRAVQLEIHMSKEEILEAYLRFAPYGGNYEGIEVATLSFWGRSPSGLSPAEIATLLAIPQNPEARRPAQQNRDRLRTARDEIAHQLAADGAIPMSARPRALASELEHTEVPVDVGGPPREIPHLVQWLKAHRPQTFERRETARGAPAVRIETTLDRSVQRRVSSIVEDHRRRLQAMGAPHGAVVVLESQTGRVRAVVGNLAFDASIEGSQMSAFAAARSTGSLLKPVVYAAALDEGLIAPSHRLQDVPTVRGDYRPQNFDRSYRGLVEAEEALTLSLNIPFVRLIENLGVDEFVQAMVRFGLEEPARRAGTGGLELVVGGMPASALEVASLYAGFARGGRPVMAEVFDVDGDDRSDGERAVSGAASWLTQRALTRRPRPFATVGPRRARDEGIVWKTGTSYAYHDAWTAGFGDHYTAAVWAGDLAFERHPELIGADAAAPLFFEIMEAVDEPFSLRSHKPSDEIAEIEVCSRSGRRPGPYCEHTTTTEAPAQTAAPARCQWHDEIAVDADSGRRIPDGCMPDGVDRIEHRIVERLPGPAARFERSRGRRAGTVPQIHPDCRAGPDASLSITAPGENTEIIVDQHRPADRQMVRLEAYSSTGSEIHWYIDGRHLQSAGPDEAVYWQPEAGQVRIAAVDDDGRRDIRQLSITGDAGVTEQADKQ